MKFLIPLSLLVSISCGKVSPGIGSLGQEMRFEPQALSASESQRLNNLCSTLGAKAALLGQAGAQSYTFNVRKKGCDEASLGASESVLVGLDGTKLKVAGNGLAFIFPDIETNQTGVMREICGNLANFSNPQKLENGNIMRVDLRSSAECNPGLKELCLYLETGAPNENSYKVISREWIRFQMDSTLPRVGFFTERKLKSSVFCGAGKNSETIAILQ
jgi:hypothetical protein